MISPRPLSCPRTPPCDAATGGCPDPGYCQKVRSTHFWEAAILALVAACVVALFAALLALPRTCSRTVLRPLAALGLVGLLTACTDWTIGDDLAPKSPLPTQETDCSGACRPAWQDLDAGALHVFAVDDAGDPLDGDGGAP
jgi:hypothetical protein